MVVLVLHSFFRWPFLRPHRTLAREAGSYVPTLILEERK